MPFDLDLAYASPLLRRVAHLFSLEEATNVLRYAGDQVGVKAEAIIQDSLYPPASRHALPLYYTRQHTSDGPGYKAGERYQSKFKTLAQQRKVFALAQQRKIPTRRSGQLGRSITSRADVLAPGVVNIRVGSNLAYAPYVIDLFLQSHYHAGTWTPIQTDIERALPALTKTAEDAAAKEAQRRLKGG